MNDSIRQRALIGALLVLAGGVGGATQSAIEQTVSDPTTADPHVLVAQAHLDEGWAAATDPEARAALIADAMELLPLSHVGIRLMHRPTLRIPDGVWEIADHDDDGAAITIARAMILDLGGATLIVPTQDENGAPLAGSVIRAKVAAQWTTIRNGILAGSVIGGAQPAPTFVEGVRVECNSCTIEQVIARELGDGFVVHGSASDGTNANGVQILSCVGFGLAGAGLRLYGGDTNGGLISGFVVTTADVGIYDGSFLGNTFAGSQLHSTRHEAVIVTAAANYSTYLGTYVEADCCSECATGYAESVKGQARVTWLGGGAAALATSGDRVGLGVSQIGFYDALPGGAGAIRVRIGHAAVSTGITVTRENAAGAAIWYADFPREVSSLGQVGFPVVGTGSGCAPPCVAVARDGLTRPFGWTGTTHAAGLGHARGHSHHYAYPGGVPAGYALPENAP